MSDIVHVIKASINPNAAPTRSGQHWVNETTKQTWLSVGTSTVSDWVLVGDAPVVKVSLNDTTADYLGNKLSAGTGITLTVLSPGGDETVEISAPGSTTDEKVKVSSNDTTPGYLSTKLVIDNGTNATNPLESSVLNPSADEDLRIRFDQTKLAITSSQVTDFAESVDDRVSALLVAGAGISLTYNDPANALTIASTITQYTDEQAQDAVATLIQNGTGISWAYNDVANTLTPTVTLAPFTTTHLAEGLNLYFTNTRAQAAISVSDTASIDLSYSAGNISGVVLPAGVNHNLLQNYFANEHINHASVSINAGTGLTGGGDITTTRTLSIANTTVTAGAYGSGSAVATFSVNAQGQLTAASSVAISISSTAVSDFAEAVQDVMGGALVDSASVDFVYNDLTNTQTANVLPAGVNHDALQNWVANKHIDHSAVSISAGTGLTGGGDITASRTISMPNVGTPGVYGSSTQVPVITTDAQGRVTSVTNTTIVATATLTQGYVGFGSPSNTLTGSPELFWDNTLGYLGIGTNTPQAHLHMVDDTGKNLIFEQSNNSLGESAFFESRKSRGTTASKTAVTAGDKLGGWGGLGYNGSSYDLSTYVNFFADGVFNGSSAPGYFSIFTTPSGSLTPVERLRVSSNGDTILFNGLMVGNTTNTTDGNLRYNGTEFQIRESATWKPIAQTPTSVSSTSAQNSTSSTFAALSSISTTPAAGSYKLDFTASAQISSATSAGEWAVFVGGTQQTVTNRRMASVSTTTIQGNIAISTTITVNGSQTVEIRFRRVSGTGTVTTTEREMILTPYAR